MTEDVPLVEFMYFVFTRMPGDSYRRLLRFVAVFEWHLFSAECACCNVKEYWTSWVTKVCKGLALFRFHSGTQPVSVFILAVNCLCFHSGSQLFLFSFWQSTVSVFILAVDCLCFHSGAWLSLITCLQTSFPGLPQVPDVAGWGTDFADGWTDCGWPEPAGGQWSAAVAGWVPGHHSPSSAGQRTSGTRGTLFHERKALLHEGKKNHFLLLLCQIKTQNGKIFKIKKLALICQYKTCTTFWWNHFPQALTKNNMNEIGSTYLAFGVIWMSFSWKCCILVIVSESQNHTRSVHSWYNGTGWLGAKQRVTYLLALSTAGATQVGPARRALLPQVDSRCIPVGQSLHRWGRQEGRLWLWL